MLNRISIKFTIFFLCQIKKISRYKKLAKSIVSIVIDEAEDKTIEHDEIKSAAKIIGQT